MKTWHDRLREAFDESGFRTRTAFAEAVGVSSPTVTGWLSGEIREVRAHNVEKISRVLGINSQWLLTGKGQKRPNQWLTSGDNVSPHEDFESRMPLIGWVAAGDWCESPDQFAPGDAEEWLPRPNNAGPRSFALRVINDSMRSPYPGERSYPPGIIIFVDPDKPVVNGCRVVARANGEYTFKQYVEDSGRIYLKPLNPQYPTLDVTEDTHICGVIIGSYSPE